MKITGGCHCGQITYEADIDEDKIGICHCTDCQVLSGSAFRTVVFTIGDCFNLLTGKLKIYTKIAESGAERIQTFCPNCGSPIYSTSTSDIDRQYSIRLGTVNQRDGMVPKFQIWCRSSQSWLNDLGHIKKIAKQE